MGTKGMAAGVVGQYMHIVDVPEFEITPVFKERICIKMRVNSIFSYIPRYKTGVKLLVFMRRQRSGMTEKSVQA